MEGLKIKTKLKFKVRHQKHKLFRANDPLLSVLMWGVNFTVSNSILSTKSNHHLFRLMSWKLLVFQLCFYRNILKHMLKSVLTIKTLTSS
jgi:hypothetical protein